MRREENMSIVIVGHVDHGKSTIIGRLLADTNSLPNGKLEQVKEQCRINSKPFEYAFLLDALKDEQAQGITIDAARVFFNTELRKYIILDAPGHIEFLKNMVTGAARAEAALLVIDANEGVMENSKRHGYLLSMLGIKQVVVLVNKMDLVDYSEQSYTKIVSEYKAFLHEIGVEVNKFVPVSGFFGDNIAKPSKNIPWYEGKTVLETLDSFDNAKEEINQVFRMPVQDVYKFTKGGDDRRIVSGTIETGKVNVGDEVIFYPSGKKSTVKSIEYFNGDTRNIDYAGMATGFTLQEQIYIKRGELACNIEEEKPCVTTRFKTKIFWLGMNNLEKDKSYYVKIGTRKIKAKVEEINMVLDASSLDSIKRDYIQRHEVAEITIKTEKEVVFDLSDKLAATSRFVIIDNYEIAGGGIITESLADEQEWVREKVEIRDEKWIKSGVSRFERIERLGQRPTLVVVTGDKNSGRKEFAKYLEKRLFIEGRLSYFLPFQNLKYGLDADIVDNYTDEHFRRLGEVLNILLDNGQIVIITVQNITQKHLRTLQKVINDHVFITVDKNTKTTSDEELYQEIKEELKSLNSIPSFQ